MFNSRFESRLKQHSLAKSSPKRRSCGTLNTSTTKGRRSNVMNDVRNVQNSINLLNNLVTTKRVSMPACREMANRIPGSNRTPNQTTLGVNPTADSGCPDPCEPLVKLVPFIDPVLPYRTSSPCRSNFRTLSTITQFRRSVSLSRVNMAQSLSSINSNLSDSMFSLADTRTPLREERPSKLSPTSTSPRDTDVMSKHPGMRSPNWTSADPLNSDSILDYGEQPINNSCQYRASTLDCMRESKLDSRLTDSSEQSKARLFNRKIQKDVMGSLSGEDSDSEYQENQKDDEIKKVCIESWMSENIDDISLEGKNLGVSIRGLDEDEEENIPSMNRPSVSLDRSSSIEDGFLCNCEFGESSECCIFHKNSLSATTAPALISSSSLHAKEGSSASSPLESTNQNPHDSCHRFEETHTNTLRESDSCCKFEEEEATQDDVTDLISAIDLGLEIPNFQLTSFDSNHSTCVASDGNINSNSTDQNFSLSESKLDCIKSTSGVAKNSKCINGEISTRTISSRDDSNDHRVNVPTTPNTLINSSEDKLSISDKKQNPIINCSNYDEGHDRKELFAPTKQNLKFLDVPNSFNDVPNAKSPCGESEFDKFSEDSFFTESDCNSLIGGIIQNMVGV